MSDQRDEEFLGDLPPMDAELAAWLADDTAAPMPAQVWSALEARLAAESDAGQVIDLAAERTRRRGGRLLPILAGAAGVALVGAVVLPSLRSPDPAPVADGATASQPVVAVPAPETADSANPSSGAVVASTPSTPSGATAVISEPVMPRAIVSTGTDYAAEDLPGQVVTLLADAGMADGMAVAAAMTASPAPTTMPGIGLAASPEALADCLTRLGLPGAIPLVLDTATIEGSAGSVIVTTGQAAPDGRPTSLHVVAVGQDCDDEDVRAARHWDLPLR